MTEIRNGLTLEESQWLTKYSRGGWSYNVEDDTVSVKGNLIISDMTMEKLPKKFYKVEGMFKCLSCKSLKSLEGFPEIHKGVKFENCLFPSEIYEGALTENISLEEYLDKHIDDLKTDEEIISILESHFPNVLHSHRGTIVSAKFGF